MIRFILFFLIFSHVFGNEAVTYSFSGGRFGDQLLCYLRAKWISYEYDIPLLYKPFPYSSELTLDKVESRFENEKFKENIYIKNSQSILPKDKRRSILYTAPYFAEPEYERNRYRYSFTVNWKDPDFRALAKELIAPKKNLQLIEPPSGSISIAVHVRRGGGYDSKTWNVSFPLKLPSINFYITALKKMVKYFEGRSLYCFIFTDEQDPGSIVKEIENAVDSPNIVFDSRRENHHTKNVLEDFFSLFNFDALIRPESSFSIIPSLLKDYAILIVPKTFHRFKDEVEIDECLVSINENLYKDLMQNSAFKIRR